MLPLGVTPSPPTKPAHRSLKIHIYFNVTLALLAIGRQYILQKCLKNLNIASVTLKYRHTSLA